MNQKPSSPWYGLLAEFEQPEDLLAAAEGAYETGYRKMDAYSPLPIHGLAAAVGFPRTNLSYIVFACGVLGAIAGYSLQYWIHVIDYPINIGGRPLHSGPSFIPVTFELTILFASLGAVFSMLGLNKLPMPYHPVFNAPNFDRASQDRFFLCIEAEDPQFDLEKTHAFLDGLNPQEVTQVEH